MSLNSLRGSIRRTLAFPIARIVLYCVGGLLLFSLAFSGLGSNLGGGGCGRAAGGAAAGPDQAVATVNGDPITRAQFDTLISRMTSYYQMQGQNIGLMQKTGLYAAVLDQLVTQRLQVQKARQMGLSAGDAEVEKQRAQLVQEAGYRQKLGLKPNASVSDIDSALVAAGSPTLEQHYPDDDLRDAILLQKLQTSLNRQTVVTEQDARLSYRKYRTRHILIGNQTRSDVQAKAQATQILAKAKAPGADFAALAKQYSEDPGTKNSGGSDGEIDQSTSYVPEFKNAAFALHPGEITLVHSPQYGYFIIKLDSVRDALPKDWDKNKAQYIAQVQQQKQQDKSQQFLQQLKSAPGVKLTVQDPALRGVQALSQARQATDPAQQQAKLKSAVADFQAALKQNSPLFTVGEINVGLAQAYQGLHQPAQAQSTYLTALQTTDDPNLRLALGAMYLQNKDQKNALIQFQAASNEAPDDQNLHQQLLMAYSQMKRSDLMAREAAWLKDYQKSQQAAPGMGGLPMSATPGGPSPAAGGAGANPAVSAATRAALENAARSGGSPPAPAGGLPTQPGH